MFGAGHDKRHRMESADDHDGDWYNAMLNAGTALTGTNPVVDTATMTAAIAAAVAGLHWKDNIDSFVDFVTNEPGGPTPGDRYINTVTGVSSGTAQSVTANYIYEWNGSSWTEYIPEDGWAVLEDGVTPNLAWVYSGTAWGDFSSMLNHAAMMNLNWAAAGHTIDTDFDLNSYRILNGEPVQAIGYYVSSVRGTTAALGADGSTWNPFDDIPEAIAKGQANGDADIIIFIDTRAGTSYPNIVLPDGEHINLIGSEPLWSDGSSIALITNGNGGALNLDGLTVNQIREGLTLGGVIRIEECSVNAIKDNAGTGFATNTDGYFNNTQFTQQTLIADINGMKTQTGTLINAGPGFYSFIVLDGLDANAKKIINMANGTIATDGMALGQRYTDAEAKLAVKYQADVACAGATPVQSDFSAWAVGDRGMATGTGSREFFVKKTGASAIKYVELT